eukprot:UN19127
MPQHRHTGLHCCAEKALVSYLAGESFRKYIAISKPIVNKVMKKVDDFTGKSKIKEMLAGVENELYDRTVTKNLPDRFCSECGSKAHESLKCKTLPKILELINVVLTLI